MTFFHELSLIEPLSIYLGQIPVKYKNGKYFPVKCFLWTSIKVVTFLLVLVLIFFVKEKDIVKISKGKYKEPIETFTIHFVRFYRIFHEIIQLTEMRWNQQKFTKTMNKLIILSNRIKSFNGTIDAENKIKILVNFLLCFLCSMQILSVTSIIYAINYEQDLYTWLNVFYHNGLMITEFIQTMYFICLIKILSKKLSSIVEHVNSTTSKHINVWIDFHRNIRKIIKNLIEVQAFQTLIHLLSLIIIFGCTFYVAIVSIIYSNISRLKYSYYLLVSHSVLLITPIMWFQMSNLQDQVSFFFRT